MDDESLMQHFESKHPEDLAMKFQPLPGRDRRELVAPGLWRTYHDTLHRLWPERYDHDHSEEGGMPPSTETIFVTMKEAKGGWYPHEAFMNRDQALRNHPNAGSEEVEQITLHRPDLRPIYGGPTLLEALWDRMDSIMERLMTGTESGEDECVRTMADCTGDPDQAGKCDHLDNGDRYRAQELAWVLAIVTDPYDPSVDRIRAEAVNRWNAQQAAEQDLITAAEAETHAFEAAGVNGYEL